MDTCGLGTASATAFGDYSKQTTTTQEYQSLMGIRNSGRNVTGAVNKKATHPSKFRWIRFAEGTNGLQLSNCTCSVQYVYNLIVEELAQQAESLIESWWWPHTFRDSCRYNNIVVYIMAIRRHLWDDFIR